MHRTLRALLLIAAVRALPAQTQPVPPVPPAGLETAWEIAPVMREIGAHADRLTPFLDRLDPTAWTNKGAPETYAEQLQAGREQARALANAAKSAAGNPEKLSASLDLLFRLQGIELLVGSLGEAIRKYQSVAASQELASLSAESGANRERLQRYIVNLAVEHEQEMRVMDQEAQRCRGTLSQSPPARNPKKK